MSQAFVKEGDDQWLNEIPPTMAALINYLTRENGGIPVYEVKVTITPTGKEIHHMSNGLLYTKNEEGEWSVVDN
jgi:hypothetical protein